MEQERFLSKPTLEYHSRSGGGKSWCRKDEEYIADFLLVSRRSLDAAEYRIFNYHFLLGADGGLCCRKLKMDPGDFYHAIYRIQERLGLVFRELEPYALFPLDEYFHGSHREPETAPKRLLVMPKREERQKLSSRIPLRRVA